jgi:hypothetical protein
MNYGGVQRAPPPQPVAQQGVPNRLLPPLQALGVGAGPTTVVATSAAIKWITKDGLGAAGRLIVGGRLASGAAPAAMPPPSCQFLLEDAPSSMLHLFSSLTTAPAVPALPDVQCLMRTRVAGAWWRRECPLWGSHWRLPPNCHLVGMWLGVRMLLLWGGVLLAT